MSQAKDKEDAQPPASNSVPVLEHDPSRRAQVRRVKNLALAERIELLDRICREQTRIATRARRIR